MSFQLSLAVSAAAWRMALVVLHDGRTYIHCVSIVSTVTVPLCGRNGQMTWFEWHYDVIMMKINIRSNASLENSKSCPGSRNEGLEFSYRLTSFLAFGLAVRSVTSKLPQDEASHVACCHAASNVGSARKLYLSSLWSDSKFHQMDQNGS